MTGPCCDRVYVCGGEIECPEHGGFDVCCDRPEGHAMMEIKTAPCGCRYTGNAGLRDVHVLTRCDRHKRKVAQ